MELKNNFYEISIVFPLGFYWISMIFLRSVPDILTGFYDISMSHYGMWTSFLWESSGTPMAARWDFHDVSVIFLWDYYGIYDWILWDSFDFCLWFFCYFHVISVSLLWYFCGIPVRFPWYFYGITIGNQLKINGKYIEIHWNWIDGKLKPLENQLKVN